MKVLMIIAYEGFRDEEYLEPKKIFQENNIEVITASWNTGMAMGKLGAVVNVDITIDEIEINQYNAIIFIGGPGCKTYWDNLIAHRIAQEAIEYNKILAAICSAPVILARAGVLKGIKSTCFSGDSKELEKEGAVYTGNPIEQDGLIITADGPDSAVSFGIRILDALREVAG